MKVAATLGGVVASSLLIAILIWVCLYPRRFGTRSPPPPSVWRPISGSRASFGSPFVGHAPMRGRPDPWRIQPAAMGFVNAAERRPRPPPAHPVIEDGPRLFEARRLPPVDIHAPAVPRLRNNGAVVAPPALPPVGRLPRPNNEPPRLQLNQLGPSRIPGFQRLNWRSAAGLNYVDKPVAPQQAPMVGHAPMRRAGMPFSRPGPAWGDAGRAPWAMSPARRSFHASRQVGAARKFDDLQEPMSSSSRNLAPPTQPGQNVVSSRPYVYSVMGGLVQPLALA